MPYELGFNAANNSYRGEGFFKLCKDYGVPHDPMRYQNKKFIGTHQRGDWSDCIGPNSMTCWIIEKSWGFTDVGSYKISEGVRAYAYLILSSQAFARSHIVGNMSNALTAQKAFLNNFENIMNHRVDIREDIRCHQDTLSYSSSKVGYSMGEGIYMTPIDMNLNIRSETAWYNNEILVSDSGFNLGKNDVVNAFQCKKVES